MELLTFQPGDAEHAPLNVLWEQDIWNDLAITLQTWQRTCPA